MLKQIQLNNEQAIDLEHTIPLRTGKFSAQYT